MPDQTDNHNLDTNHTEGESWGLDEEMDTIEKRLVIRDTEANRSNYTAHDGAIFIATDTGAVYDGDGSSWSKASRELDSVGVDELYTAGRAAEAVVYQRSGTTYAVDESGVIDSGSSPATVINSAIDSVGAAEQGAVYLVSDTYEISSTVLLDQNHVHLMGSVGSNGTNGVGCELRLANSANTNMVEVSGEKCGFSRIALTGNKGNNTSGHGLVVNDTGAKDFNMFWSYLLNTPDKGVYHKKGGVGSYRYVFVENAAGEGFHFDNPATQYRLDWCVAFNGGAVGYWFKDTEKVFATNSFARANNFDGWRFERLDDSTFVNCLSYKNENRGYRVLGSKRLKFTNVHSMNDSQSGNASHHGFELEADSGGTHCTKNGFVNCSVFSDTTNSPDHAFHEADSNQSPNRYIACISEGVVNAAFDLAGTNSIALGCVPAQSESALTAKDTGTVDGTYGTSEADVIKNNRTRIEEIEAALQNKGLLN